jgi:toxin ParE1/3/4
MRIRWLRKALRNLDEEADYISQDDAAAARRVVQRIHNAVQQLADNPALGRAGRIPGTRELVVSGTRYLVPYRVRPALDQIEILRVFHCARRLPKRW